MMVDCALFMEIQVNEDLVVEEEESVVEVRGDEDQLGE